MIWTRSISAMRVAGLLAMLSFVVLGGCSCGGVCDGVDCGRYGSCVEELGQAACSCISRYHAEGLRCVEDNQPPVITNLPATRSTMGLDRFQVLAEDLNVTDTLSWSIVFTDCYCYSPVYVNQSGEVTWACYEPTFCIVDITVTDDGSPILSDTGTLTIDSRIDQP